MQHIVDLNFDFTLLLFILNSDFTLKLQEADIEIYYLKITPNASSLSAKSFFISFFTWTHQEKAYSLAMMVQF